MKVTTRRRLVWWLFDHAPGRFQDWAEAWARTLVVRRTRQRPLVWTGSTSSTIPDAKVTYRAP